jgi:uncharacterized membrane protein YbhN (UPF0104 family)
MQQRGRPRDYERLDLATTRSWLPAVMRTTPEALGTSPLRTYLPEMGTNRQTAIAEFKHIIAVIGVVAVLMVIGALTYLSIYSTLDANTAIATTPGVFFSTLLGCGLFAAAFFSDKSGHDQNVTDASKSERERR